MIQPSHPPRKINRSSSFFVKRICRYLGTLNPKTCLSTGFSANSYMLIAAFVSVERLERSTNGLKGHCSTFELHARFFSEKYSIMPRQCAQALTFFTPLANI